MKLYPEIVLAANNNPDTALMIGGVKFYFVAKHYDREGGSGLIHETKFKEYTMQYLGISRATYYRWKKQAKTLRLFIDHGGILQLVSWGKAALACSCDHVTRPVDVSVREFVGNEGLSEVWAGYMKRHEPKEATEKAPRQKQRPITKTTLRQLTGIPESTQRYYEAKAGVIKTPNIAIIASVYKGAENAPTEPGGGYYAKNGCHRQRLGNTYHAPKRIKQLKRGRINKINRTIKAALSLMPGSDQSKKAIKLFFHPAIKQRPDKENRRLITSKIPPDILIMRYLRKLANIDAQKRPEWIYGYDRTCLGFGLWTAWDVKTGVSA